MIRPVAVTVSICVASLLWSGAVVAQEDAETVLKKFGMSVGEVKSGVIRVAENPALTEVFNKAKAAFRRRSRENAPRGASSFPFSLILNLKMRFKVN